MCFPNCPSTLSLMKKQALKLLTNTGKHQHALCCQSQWTSVLASIKEGYGSDPFFQCLANTGAPGVQLINGLWYIGDHLVIPCTGNICENLFRLAHDTLRHFGADKSYAMLRDTYYWPNMRADLEKSYISSCEECQHNKYPTKKAPGLLEILSHMDIHITWSSITWFDHMDDLIISCQYCLISHQ